MDTSQIRRTMYNLERRTMGRMYTYAQQSAGQLGSDSRTSAPWCDRSGAARGGIAGRVEMSGSVIRITLSGSVRYMVYLELAQKALGDALAHDAAQRGQHPAGIRVRLEAMI